MQNRTKIIKSRRMNSRMQKTQQFHDNQEEEEKNRIKNKLRFVGELSLCNSEETFKKMHPPESRIDYTGTDGFKNIKFIDNGPKYSRYVNPYEKMVNLAMIDTNQNLTKFSFKAKSFYEKAVELSMNPQYAKMDPNNPIYQYITNPKDYKYYNLEGI